jgi:hypothetical protein
MEKMQKNFMEATVLAPSVIACATYYENNKDSLRENAFTRYCEDVFIERLDYADKLSTKSLLESKNEEGASKALESTNPFRREKSRQADAKIKSLEDKLKSLEQR